VIQGAKSLQRSFCAEAWRRDDDYEIKKDEKEGGPWVAGARRQLHDCGIPGSQRGAVWNKDGLSGTRNSIIGKKKDYFGISVYCEVQ
jgi:hypothetical protein